MVWDVEMTESPASLKVWGQLCQTVRFRFSFLVIKCNFFVVAKRTAEGIRQGSLMG